MILTKKAERLRLLVIAATALGCSSATLSSTLMAFAPTGLSIEQQAA